MTDHATTAVVIGVDTCGTFTDLVAVDARGDLTVAKHPSSPDEPEGAVARVLAKAGISGDRVRRVVHGTTVATNAVIQRQGANVALLITEGFEDIPFIQRINRRSEYDLHWLKPEPLVRRRNCFGVRERTNAAGMVVRHLDAHELDRLGSWLRGRQQAERIDAVAVCLLFSYLNPANESALADYLRKTFPDLELSLSHAVAPIWREYERSSTTLADAFVKPLLKRYSRKVGAAFADAGMIDGCFSLKSNGGVTPLSNMARKPVDSLLSGLAGGIVGGRFAAATAGMHDVVTLDMGGTSADVGLIVGGQPRFTTEFEIEWGLPVAIPVVEVRTLGAGGGSIAWIDKGGMLNVGPHSAGAQPGPACYQQGGEEPTVTDANLVLGRLDPDYFLGGEIPLDVGRAREAIEPIASRLSVSVQAAASAIVDIADENMTNAIRLMTIERGIDPRRFGLVAFGGAGPLHAVAIAKKLGMSTVIVPPHPGLVSALGAAISDLRVEKVQTLGRRTNQLSEAELNQRFDMLLEEARSELRSEGSADPTRAELAISLRYYQQNYEQDVTYEPESGLGPALRRFHDLHHRFYGYHFEDQPIECIHLKVSLSEAFHSRPGVLRAYATDREPAPPVRRRVWLTGRTSASAPVVGRSALRLEDRLVGPLIVQELDSTTFVPDTARVRVDSAGNLLIEVGAAQ